MISFLKDRSRKSAAAREAAGANATSLADRAAPMIDATMATETAPTAASATLPERYEIREHSEGCSIYDNHAGDVAETYGYRLTTMSRARAESLVAVLNRGEMRRRDRNG
jgi:hypothetical protein